MDLVRIKRDVSEQILALRSLERLVSSYEFEAVFEEASIDEKCQLVNWINTLNVREIKLWVKKKLTDEPNCKELRHLASRLRIPNYGRMDKWALLTAVERKNGKNQNHFGLDFGNQAGAP